MTDNNSPPLARVEDFANTATVYDGARPVYKFEWIERIFEEARIQAGDIVAELGAGTGGLSKVILQSPNIGKLYCIALNLTLRCEQL